MRSTAIAESSEPAANVLSAFDEKQLNRVNRIPAHAHTMHVIETADLKMKLHHTQAKLQLARQIIGPKATKFFDFIDDETLKP